LSFLVSAQTLSLATKLNQDFKRLILPIILMIPIMFAAFLHDDSNTPSYLQCLNTM